MSDHTLGDAPIEPKFHGIMNALARGLDEALNPSKPRTIGFVLLVYPLNSHEGRCNYVSNSNHEDVVVLLREQLARFQGHTSPTGHA